MPDWCFSAEEKALIKRIKIYSDKIDSYVKYRIEETKKGNPMKNADFLELHIQEFLKDENAPVS